MPASSRYAEGDWFAVPLRSLGFGVGLISRVNREGVLLGYFFGPRRTELPTIADLAGLHPEDAITVRKFGHLGLRSGSWPIIGRQSDWNREAWPMPVFVRYEELTGRSFRVFYDPDDPNRVVREEPAPAGAAEHGPKDGLLGSGAVEKVLTSMLNQ